MKYIILIKKDLIAWIVSLNINHILILIVCQHSAAIWRYLNSLLLHTMTIATYYYYSYNANVILLINELWVERSGGITVYYFNNINKTTTFTQTKYEPIKIIKIYGIYNNSHNVGNSKNRWEIS